MSTNEKLEQQFGAPLPEGVDFDAQEAMSAEQLQHLLRQDFTGHVLRFAVVQVKNPQTPWMFNISGAFNCYGTTQFWETEIDIRGIEDADDFIALVNKLNEAFNQAAERIGKGQTGHAA